MSITKINTPELLDINTTGAKRLPSGPTTGTGGRPTTGLTAGDFRYNTTDNRVEYYDGAAWFQIDDEALPSPIPVGSENFNTNTYFGTGATQAIDAKFNEAANFNGSSSHITISNPLGTGNVAYSVSAWIYLNATSHTGGIYTIWDGTASSGNNLFFKVEGGKISIGNYGTSVTSVNTLAVNQWVHVAVTRDTSNNVELYVNGQPDTSGTLTLSLGNYNTIIGALSSTVQNFNGKIDQVRIYNSALGATQVEDLYTDETTTTASSLSFPSGETAIATYQLDGNGDDISGTYSATSTTDIGYTGLKFQPDFVWIKRRNAADLHVLTDSVRGTSKQLFSDLADAESVTNTRLTSFDTNGFTLSGSGTRVNDSGGTYVAWNWYAPTAQSISATGTGAGARLASTIKKNVDAGFSIVSYTGGNNTNNIVGHGLDSAPELILFKSLTQNAKWEVYAEPIGANNYLTLNENNAKVPDIIRFRDTSPTDEVFTVGLALNGNSIPYIAYCFTSILEYSKVGSYPGNGNASGPIVPTGFEPGFLMIKNTNGIGPWFLFDNVRNPSNNRNRFLEADIDNIESVGTSNDYVSFNSTNFTLTVNYSSLNGIGGTYLYLAIA